MILEEFRKSINSILYERVTSPFWGALTSSWIIWNWELIYITLFVSEEKIPINKLAYIKENYPIDPYNSLLIPLGISLIILVFIPVISNGAYWLSLFYKDWKVKKKQEIEKTTLLSFKESTEIREEILKQEEKFHKLNIEKDERIIDLNEQVNKLQNLLDNSRIVLDEKEENIKYLNERISCEIDKKNDYLDIFSEEWAYQIGHTNIDKQKYKFRLYGNDRFEIENQHYTINTIYRYRKESFKILLLADRSDDIYKIRYISINRSKNMDDFEGFEWAIKEGVENKYIAERNHITIHKI